MSRIFGLSAIHDLLRVAPEALTAIHILEGESDEAIDALVARASAAGVKVKTTPRVAQRRRAGGRGGSRVSADVRAAPTVPIETLTAACEPTPLILIVDGVTDPHNFGAILRSAAAFGVTAVICAKQRQAPLNDAALRASAGAVATVPVIRVPNLNRVVRQLRKQGVWVFASMPGAEKTYWETDLTVPVALVVGAEGAGVRPGLVKACDLSLKLPMSEKIQSINVSVFTGVVLAEVYRQRLGARV